MHVLTVATMSTFAGFSEEDLKRMKSPGVPVDNGDIINTSNVCKIENIGFKKKITSQYKLPIFQKQETDDALDSTVFDKCKLSLRLPSSDNDMKSDVNESEIEDVTAEQDHCESVDISKEENEINVDSRKSSTVDAPDVVRCADYSEDDLAAHKLKLEALQLKQKLMEEQNKKRKEMLAKALADRTKKTEEEVMKLEKIKKELQVLDGQFSHDVGVLRKKIDQASHAYSEAEKNYLKIEKEFLQAKINLQKEKEKKELLSEHLCALITHNETRKAQKLETLMLELSNDKKTMGNDLDSVDESPIIIDGVDERTGKMVEMFPDD